MVVFTVVNASNSVGVEININYQDPGFQNLADPFDTGGVCSGVPESTFCSLLTNADTNESCEYITGCSWTGTECVGSPIYSICTPSMNYTLCRSLGCTWTTYTSQESSSITPGDPVDISPITKTIAVMVGYNGLEESKFLNIPSKIVFMFTFFLFWIPFVMLIIAIYFALPFAH